ncbi:MAG: hypothetical protein ACE5EX_02455 [Phycisphaerae bacterium]
MKINQSRMHGISCDQVRIAIDGDHNGGAEALSRSSLDTHLAACGACRAYRDESRTLGRVLQRMPLVPFPRDALTELLHRTVEAEPARDRGPVESRNRRSAGSPGGAAAHERTPRRRRRARVPLATAAALVLAVGAAWYVRRGAEEAEAARLSRAVDQTRFVLDVTSRALRRVEHAAVDEVLEKRVTPALQRVATAWSRVTLPKRWRSGT